jgi:hypothetical protein
MTRKIAPATPVMPEHDSTQAKHGSSSQPPQSSGVPSTSGLRNSMQLGSSIPSEPGAGVVEDHSATLKNMKVLRDKAKEISNLWAFLQGCCPVCWALKGTLHHCTLTTKRDGNHQLYFTCQPHGTSPTVTWKGWLDVKKAIKFQKHYYCRWCHCPIADFEPPCHLISGTHHPQQRCSHADYLSHIVWVIRHLGREWKAAVSAFNIPHDVAYGDPVEKGRYANWLSLDSEQGCFHNGIELTLWFLRNYRPLNGCKCPLISNGNIS